MNTTNESDRPESADLVLADRIDIVCDEFEQAWLTGNSPRIEEFLDRYDGLCPEQLLAELLLLDRELRIRQGECAPRESYLRRFPDYSTLVDSLDFGTIDERGRSRPGWSRPACGAGTKLAHFELVEEVGTGASGTVWKARDIRLRRLVAIKIARYQKLPGVERERFAREAQACAQLKHPSIVAVYEVGSENGQFFIVSELIQGQNLRDWLHQHPLKPAKAAELAAQLAEGLHHAHEHGVVHRDFKPANVLIDNVGTPHITDFGLAKWAGAQGELTLDGQLLGTIAYMAPEQARGEVSKLDRRTDVYALGVVLYEMLVGRCPYCGEEAALLHAIVHQEPESPRKLNSRIPRDLETICLKAIEKNPGWRYESAKALACDLRKFLHGDPIAARPLGFIKRIWRKCRRRPTIALAVGLLIVACLGVFSLASLVDTRHNLVNVRRQLDGNQHVWIQTDPPGAKLAIVPLDGLGTPTSELNRIIRPVKGSPIAVDLLPGEYLIEAATIVDGSVVGLAEVCRTIPRQGDVGVAMKHLEWTQNKEGTIIPRTIHVVPTATVLKYMALVRFNESLTESVPRPPAPLLVDVDQTLPESLTDAKSQPVSAVGFDNAVANLEKEGKRLPSAAEFDAIVQQVAKDEQKMPSNIRGLMDARPEFTSSRYAGPSAVASASHIMSDVMILKGFDRALIGENYIWSGDRAQLIQPRGNSTLPTAYRGVRSLEPRFIER